MKCAQVCGLPAMVLVVATIFAARPARASSIYKFKDRVFTRDSAQTETGERIQLLGRKSGKEGR
jgi:predicted alternative tryptophan synthase beta-subunit